MNEEGKVARALDNVAKMLDDRKVTGEDREIPFVHNCPGFITGMSQQIRGACFLSRISTRPA